MFLSYFVYNYSFTISTRIHFTQTDFEPLIGSDFDLYLERNTATYGLVTSKLQKEAPYEP